MRLLRLLHLAFAALLYWIGVSTFTTSSFAIDATNGLNSINTLNGLPNSAQIGNGPQSTLSVKELESGIVESFIQNDCARINAMAGPRNYTRFRPLVLAIVGYCKKDRSESEEIFKKAESLRPHDELILILHAQSIFRFDPEAAKPMWAKIYVVAQNPALKRIAEDYLEGTVKEGETLSILGSNWTYFSSIELTGLREDNPTGQAASLGIRPASWGMNNILFGGANRRLGTGNSIGINALVTTNTYFSSHDADFWENDFEIPYTVRVGTNEDLVFRPMARYSQYGDLSYEVMGGFALTGVAYRENYKQSVQTSIYQNHYFLDVVSPESGTHFRFEYNWEFYPVQQYLRFLAFIEHVSAQEDTTITPGADIPYSHNDLGTAVYFDYRLTNLILSFYPSFSVREDDNDSVFQNGNGVLVSKRRSDMTVDFKIRAAVPISRSIEGIVYYDWTRTYSSMRVGDYLDRTYTDRTVGAGIRIFLANY